MDADHLGDLAAPINAARAWKAGAAPLAKAGDELAALWAPRSTSGCFIGLVCTVAIAAAIALDLSADGRWCSPEPSCNGANHFA